MSSRDSMIQAAKQRAQAIQKYIDANPGCDTKTVHNAFTLDQMKALPVYDLPRRLVRLNPTNGRFKAELDVIQHDRKLDNKPIELDPENKDDVGIIQDMIKGNYPPSPDRKRAYKNLLVNMREVAMKMGTNGQEVPGLITHDGILINGNRRWTIMEELASGDKKKHPGEPLQYDKIRVALLDRDVDKYTMWKNEAKEQISQDSREEYDYVNSALEIKRGYDLLIDRSMSDKKAKMEIAKTVYGRDEKDITAYLEFLEIADLFLEYVGKPGQYTFVQESGDNDKGVVTILQEISKEIKKHKKPGGMDIEELNQWLKVEFIFCMFSKQKPTIILDDGSKKQLTFGHREYRQFQKKILDPPTIRSNFLKHQVIENIDLADKPEKHAKEFYQAVRESQEEYDINEDINTPVSLLKTAKTALGKVSQDLTGTLKDSKVNQIKQEGGLQYLKDIMVYIKDIKNKME